MTLVDRQWVVLELTRLGEKEKPEDLLEILKNEVDDDDVEIFIPAKTFIRKNNRTSVTLMEGYVFFSGGKPASFYFDLEDMPQISKVLTKDDNTGRYIKYLPDNEIQTLKDKLQVLTVSHIEEGDRVDIIDGVYKNLEGVVLGFNVSTEYALVQIIGLVSLETVVELPLQFLERIDD